MRSSMPCIGLLALLAAAPAAAREVVVPVQGTLAEADGTPVEGAVEVRFRLYGDDQGTERLWFEERVVAFDGGAFTVHLGDDRVGAPIDATLFRDHGALWLGIQVDGDDEMPLVEVGWSPYAAFAEHASDADTLGGLGPADLRPAGVPIGWGELDPSTIPADLADGDDDTLYGAGTWLELDATNTLHVRVSDVLAACYDTEAELRAALDAVYLPDVDTTYDAGDGLLLDGDVFTIDPDWFDARIEQALLDDPSLVGDLLPADLLDGDDDTTYSAGFALELAGTVFHVDEEVIRELARGVAFDTEAELRAVLDALYRPADWLPTWGEVQGVPADLLDGDDDTTYEAGDGLSLADGAFVVDGSWVDDRARAVCLDDEAELHALLDDDYLPADHVTAWGDLQDVPGDLLDGDQDTVWTPGEGLVLSLLELAVDRTVIDAWIREAAFDTVDELTTLLDPRYRAADWQPAWGDLADIPPELEDGDDDTTYAPGEGLALNNGTFSVVKSTVEGWARAVIASDGLYAGKGGSNEVFVSRMTFNRSCDSGSETITYVDPTGAAHVLDTHGLAPGAMAKSGGLAVVRGISSTDTRMFFDIDVLPSQACTLLHAEDDKPRTGYYFATDSGNDVASVWGNATTGTFILAREGEKDSAILDTCSSYAIVCF